MTRYGSIIRPALYPAIEMIGNAKLALSRELSSDPQIEDALRSAEYFINLAKASLAKRTEPA